MTLPYFVDIFLSAFGKHNHLVCTSTFELFGLSGHTHKSNHLVRHFFSTLVAKDNGIFYL